MKNNASMDPKRQPVKTWIEYAGFLVVRTLCRMLPFRWAGAAGSVLGLWVFLLTPIRKRVTLDNLEHAFPDRDARARRAIAKGAFRNYGRAILEMLWEWSATPEEIRARIHPVNPEIAVTALRRNNGVVLLSAHFGSWELLLASVYFVLGAPMTVIVQRQRNRKIDALVDRHRSRFEVHTVDMGQSIREALRTLNAKGVVFLLGDQSGSKESIYVPVFGRPAATHRGPAAFALKTGAAIIMEFLVRRSDGEYDAYFEEVDHHDLHGSGEENIFELTRRHIAMLEKYVRAYPDHWLWMHKRWKHTAFYEANLAGRGHAAPRTTV